MEKTVDSKAVAGVSIVEIMISLVLVALALVAVTTVFPRINMHRKGIVEAEQAKMIAVEALENLQYYSYFGCDKVKSGVAAGNMNSVADSIMSGEDKEAFIDFLDKYAAVEIGAAKYSVIWNNGNDITCGGDINTATVTIMWAKSGKTHKVKMTGALR